MFLYAFKQIIDALPGSLALQLMFIHHEHMIRRIPFLHLQRPAFAEALVRVLKPLRMKPNEVLYYEGDLGSTLYFVVAGLLQKYLVVPTKNSHEEPKVVEYLTLGEGTFAGEVRSLALGTQLHE